MQQALEVALPHIRDTKTLVACSLVNQRCRQSTLDAVRLNLPSLVQHVRAALKGISNDDSKLQQLQWLCSGAGPAAVNTHEAGCAILQLLDEVCWFDRTPGPDHWLRITGLVITNGLLTLAVTDCIGVLDCALRHCDSQVDPIYKLVASVEPEGFPRHQHDNEWLWPQIAAALPSMTAAQMPDLMRMAARRNAACLQLLLDHDRDHVHWLHDSNAASSQQRADAAARPQDSSSASQQQQLPDRLQFLMAELDYGGSVVLDAALQLLLNVPAAQKLSTLQVTRLLYLAACDNEKGCDLSQPSVMASLARLPGAQAVSADCIATFTHNGISDKRWQHLMPLLQLPGAKLISSQRLCQLILKAAQKNMMELFQKLCRLADGRQLVSKHVVRLMKAFLKQPRLLNHDVYDAFFGNEVDQLDALDPGRHLGGDGILELLEYCTQNGFTSDVEDVCWFETAPAQVTDTQRLAAVLKEVRATYDGEYDMIETLLKTSLRHAMLQLQSEHWANILRSGREIEEGVLALPAVQQFSAAQVGELLQHYISTGCFSGDTLLLTLPAAQQLPPALLGGLLLQMLHAPRPQDTASFDLASWDSLLRLPAAQHIEEAVLQELLDLALQLGLPKAARSLQQRLPKAAALQCTLGGQQLVRSIIAACRRSGGGWGDALLLVQQPGMQGLSAESIAVLLQELLHASPARLYGTSSDTLSDYGGLSDVEPDSYNACAMGVLPGWERVLQSLRLLPGFQQLSVRHVPRLIALYATKCHVSSRTGRSFDLSFVTQLPAAAELTPGQLLQLLKDLCGQPKSQYVWFFWVQLLKLPGGQQMDPAQFAQGLKLGLVSLITAGGANSNLETSGLPVLLSEHPAAARLTSQHIADVVKGIMGYSDSLPYVQVLLQHPAGQPLTSVALSEILRAAVDAPQLMALLLTHPAACDIDASVVFQLLELCLEYAKPCSCGSLLLQLPAAQQLSVHNIKALLQLAMQAGDAACCTLLSAHPAVASGGDEELQVLLDIVKPWGFKCGVPEQLRPKIWYDCDSSDDNSW